jgi:hypothetical protein
VPSLREPPLGLVPPLAPSLREPPVPLPLWLVSSNESPRRLGLRAP